MKSPKASAVGLVAFLIIVYFRFKLGSIVTATSVNDWYQSLNKAPFNPPNGSFSPVWIVLYFLMAVSGWLVWRHEKSRAVWVALLLFGVQLAMNLGWSLLFFGMKRIDLALIEMILLLLGVVANTVLFWRIDRCRCFACSLCALAYFRVDFDFLYLGVELTILPKGMPMFNAHLHKKAKIDLGAFLGSVADSDGASTR